MSTLLNTVSASLVSGLSRATLYRRMRDGKIGFVMYGRHRMILLHTLPLPRVR